MHFKRSNSFFYDLIIHIVGWLILFVSLAQSKKNIWNSFHRFAWKQVFFSPIISCNFWYFCTNTNTKRWVRFTPTCIWRKKLLFLNINRSSLYANTLLCIMAWRIWFTQFLKYGQYVQMLQIGDYVKRGNFRIETR